MTDSKRPKEPQSYGSEADWLSGKTGETVQNTPNRVSRHDEEFYEDRHQSKESEAPDGGMQTPKRADLKNAPAADQSKTEITGTATTKVSDASDRKSFFKKRDY